LAGIYNLLRIARTKVATAGRLVTGEPSSDPTSANGAEPTVKIARLAEALRVELKHDKTMPVQNRIINMMPNGKLSVVQHPASAAGNV
jgi:hypothetical protein